MEIKPTHVTFEQAKWLKEKGFDFYVPNIYNEKVLSTPEQWQVVEWLRVEKDIYVVSHFNTLFLKGKYNILIHKISLQTICPMPNKIQSGYDSPQEAYSAAFDYILNNLI